MEYVTCAPRTATIQENTTQCFKDIPINTPMGVGFVRPFDPLFVSTSAPRPCSKHFGLKILTQKGILIKVNPQLKTIPVSGVLPSTRGNRGLYSTKELESW